MLSMPKTSWKIFVDLQCPYSRKCWQRLPALKEAFQDDYDFEFYLTSLLFHPQAFTAQCAATFVKSKCGQEAYQQYCDACFQHQERYMNAAIGDARKSEIDAVFCDIAKQAGILSAHSLSKDEMMEGMKDWEGCIKPAYAEHKIALGYQVYGTPKHVINEKLIPDTESEWGVEEWREVLNKLN